MSNTRAFDHTSLTLQNNLPVHSIMNLKVKCFQFLSFKVITVTVIIFCTNILMLLILGNLLDLHNSTVSKPFRGIPKPLRFDLPKQNVTKIFDLDFQFIVNNECKKMFQPRIVWIVTSYYSHIELRSAFRRSYSAALLQEFGIRRVFLLAQSKKNEISQSAIHHENSRYGDLIQGNFIEDYRNLTYKHIMGLKWAVTYCGQFKYLIKMDDDIVVNFFELLSFLSGYQGEITLMGYLMTHMEVIRREANKWFVKNKEFQNSEYPPFLSGWLYVSTSLTITKLLSCTNEVPYFWIDDVYVTGLLAQKAHVRHQMINSKFTTDYHYLKCCFKYNFICDIFVGPNGGDNNLQVEFFKYSEKCHYKKCPPRPQNFSVHDRCVLRHESKQLLNGKASIDVLI